MSPQLGHSHSWATTTATAGPQPQLGHSHSWATTTATAGPQPQPQLGHSHNHSWATATAHTGCRVQKVTSLDKIPDPHWTTRVDARVVSHAGKEEGNKTLSRANKWLTRGKKSFKMKQNTKTFNTVCTIISHLKLFYSWFSVPTHLRISQHAF